MYDWDNNKFNDNINNDNKLSTGNDGLILIHGGKFLMGSPEEEMQKQMNKLKL